MWRNNRGTWSDEWMSEFGHADSRVPALGSEDPGDERLMKYRFEDFSGLASYKGRQPRDVSLQNELNRKLWMDRDLHNQAVAPRKLSRSVKGDGDNTGVYRLERSSTGPRPGLFVHRDEDLYLNQETGLFHRRDHRTQNEHQRGDKSYPVMPTEMDFQQAVAFKNSYFSNSFGSRNCADPQRAVLEGAMISYSPNDCNSQMQKCNHEGSVTGPLEYSIQSFEDCYNQPQPRFPEHPYNHHPSNSRFQGGDRLFCHDPYLYQSSTSNNSDNFPTSIRNCMTLPSAAQREMPVGPAFCKCSCCRERLHLQDAFKPNSLTEYPSLRYEHSQMHNYFRDYGSYQNFPSKSTKNSIHIRQGHRKLKDPKTEAAQARKENSPPLPGPYAPPYVLCQGCGKVVQISTQSHFQDTVLKVRCSACRGVSKFCNIVHPCYQMVLKEGKAAGSSQQANSIDSSTKQKVASVAVHPLLEPKPTVHVEERKPEHPVHVEDEQIEVSESYDGVHDISGFTSKTIQDQGSDETDGNSLMPWSRSGTFHEDSSSLFSASESTSAKTTIVDKLQDFRQSDTNVGSVPSAAGQEDVARVEYSSDVCNPCVDQMDNKEQAFLSEDLQGLMLECLHEGSFDGGKAKAKDGCTSLKNRIHQDTHCKPDSLSNDSNQEESMFPRSQNRVIENNSSLTSNDISSCKVLLQTEKTDCSKAESGTNEAEASDDGATCSTANDPEPGSPLYRYLSYDSGSEIAKALINHLPAKQSTHTRPSRDTSKGSSFLTNFLKKNMQLANAGQGNNKSADVVVNGRRLSLNAVKSAEKLAGTIRPGLYWYDYEAGFWGVMGGPCLGIIPPFIPEFKMPLSKDCAGGTTDILVNGRELHKKDLDVLAGRGLPRTSGKSYMVDISGQVIDKSSGQMLRTLGRLAPTIQKRGRGCGMFQPPRH